MFITKEKALKFAEGRQAKLARELGITRQAVNAWPDKEYIPQKHAVTLVRRYGEEPFK